jgi:hypothetical protein
MPNKNSAQYQWTEEENNLLQSYVHIHLGGKSTVELSWKKTAALMNEAINNGTISNTGQVFHAEIVEIRWFQISRSSMSF